MTLCLAWKYEDEYFFASDSRLTDPGLKITSNEATKIFKVGVEIYGATDSGTPNAEPQLLHRTNYGMCFSGSYLNGSILADTISEVLSSIQLAPGISDISMDNLSNIAFAVYRKVSDHLMSIHRQYGLSSVFFGGYCLSTGVFKFYKFHSIIEAGQPVVFDKQEIILSGTPAFLGDNNAITSAKNKISQLKPGYTYFHLLRDTIEDDNIPTVGGKIQCGHFKVDSFRTNGIVEYTLETDDSGMAHVHGHFNYRGLSLDLDDNELRSGDLNIMKTFFDPFEQERWALLKKAMKNNDPTAYDIDNLYD